MFKHPIKTFIGWDLLKPSHSVPTDDLQVNPPFCTSWSLVSVGKLNLTFKVSMVIVTFALQNAAIVILVEYVFS